MLKIKNGGLDQYGAEPFEQQQLGTSGVEGVKVVHSIETILVGISVLPREVTLLLRAIITNERRKNCWLQIRNPKSNGLFLAQDRKIIFP